jgi:hypothetical protein
MNFKHGLSKDPIYRVWRSMISRCTNPNQACWRNYGGRGILVCDRWNSFENFIEDMGPRPSPQHSIDRIDVNGDYEPNNCRWATKEEQSANRRDNKLVTFRGELIPLFLAAKASGVPVVRFRARVRIGYSADEAGSPDFDGRAKLRDVMQRKASERTHCRRGHELTPENTYLYSADRPVRCCKKCRAEGHQRRKHFAEPVSNPRVVVRIG